MKSNKGFTLIELLAVIVILAIVALVATPVILNIINSNTNKAKDSSSRLVIRSVELAYTTFLSDPPAGISAGTYPTTVQLAQAFNGIMDSATTWDEDTPVKTDAIVSGNVKCTVTNGTGDYAGKIQVSCPMTDNTNITSKWLTIKTS